MCQHGMRLAFQAKVILTVRDSKDWAQSMASFNFFMEATRPGPASCCQTGTTLGTSVCIILQLGQIWTDMMKQASPLQFLRALSYAGASGAEATQDLFL